MKFLPPLHIACSKDEMRLALMHIEVLDGIATATNGSLIVRLNLAAYSSLDEHTIMKLSGRYIHKDIWQLLHDADNIFFDNDDDPDVITYIKGGVQAEIRLKQESELEYPAYQSLIDKIANTRFDSKSFISFNPEWIVVAKKIFSSDSLIMRFYEQESMFTIFPGNDAKAFMGIAPTMLTEEDAVFDFSLT